MQKRMLQRNVSLILLSISIVIISYYLFINNGQSGAQEIIHKNAVVHSKYSTTMKNITIKEFSKDGDLNRITYAKCMSHADKEDLIVAEEPEIHVLDKSKDPYVVNADLAETTKNFSRITLIGNVNITQDGEHEHTKIDGDFITFYPNRDYAETNEEITIVYQHNLTLKSKGMTADFNKKIFTMDNNARGVYYVS